MTFRKKRNEHTHYKVYRYGAILKPKISRDEENPHFVLIQGQIQKANEFYNALVDIEIARRNEWNAIIDADEDVIKAKAAVEEACDRVEAAERALKDARCKTGKRRPDHKLAKAVSREKRKKKKAKKAVKSAKGKAQKKERKALDIQEKKFKALFKEARAEAIANGLYWGTAAVTMEALPDGGPPPSKRNIYEEGQIAVQVQCNSIPDKYFQIHDQEGWRSKRPGKLLYIRVASLNKAGEIYHGGHTPVWAKIPFLLDRPLPDAPIKWIQVVKKRVGLKSHWSISFTVELPGKRTVVERVEKAQCRGKVIAFDLGWRKMGDGSIRVAYGTDSSGKSFEVVVPAWLSNGWDRVQSIRSTRDKLFDQIRNTLHEWRWGRKMPEWLTEKLKFSSKWKAQKRLVGLLTHWKEHRFEGDASMVEAIVEWEQKDRHLLHYERYHERQCINHRRELYRHWARWLVQRYDAVIFEDLNFANLYRKPDIESKKDGVIGFHRRASPGIFRLTIEHAFVDEKKRAVRVEHEGSSQTCASCWEITMSVGKEVKAKCEACGYEADRDCNASRVLLARGGVVRTSPGRRTYPKDKWYRRLMDAPRRVLKGRARLKRDRSQKDRYEGDFAGV